MQLALYIAYPGVDLAAAYTTIQRLQQLGEWLALHRNEFQREQKSNQTRIGIPVVAEVEMARVLTSKDGIRPAHFCLNIGMPHASAHSLATQSIDQFGHAFGDN